MLRRFSKLVRSARPVTTPISIIRRFTTRSVSPAEESDDQLYESNLSFWKHLTAVEESHKVPARAVYSAKVTLPTTKVAASPATPTNGPFVVPPEMRQTFSELVRFTELHPFWNNKIFQACQKGEMTKEDFKFFFEQYYLYSINFTRFVAGVMYRCEDDSLRSRLTKNLYLESGGSDTEKRHAELFRKFMSQTMGVEMLDKINFLESTKKFVKSCLTHTCSESALFATAFLSLGTEGIVSATYQRLVDGMIKAGIPKSELEFFYLHIDRSDEIADTLAQLMFHYRHDPNWASTCRLAADMALNLRTKFFDAIANHIQEKKMEMKKFEGAISFGDLAINRRTGKNPEAARLPDNVSPVHRNVLGSVAPAYSAERKHPVYPLNLPSTTVNLAIGDILPGEKTNKHRHAYESLIYVMEGEGFFQVEDKMHELKAGDALYIPPWNWHSHQAKANSKLRYIQATNLPLIGNYLKLTPIRQEEGDE